MKAIQGMLFCEECHDDFPDENEWTVTGVEHRSYCAAARDRCHEDTEQSEVEDEEEEEVTREELESFRQLYRRDAKGGH